MSDHAKRLLFACAILVPFVLSGMPFADAGNPKRGKALFNDRACIGCHSIGNQGTATTGPNLAGVTKLRTQGWLEKWIAHPDQMMGDPAVKDLMIHYPTPMPATGVTDAEAQDLYAYLKAMDSEKK